MIKADKRALAYAKSHACVGYDYDQTYDAVKYGYLQAEKDLALTLEDIKYIVQTFHRIICDTENITSNEGYLKTLQIFNEYKLKKQT